MEISLIPVEAGDEAFLFQLYTSTRQEELAGAGWDAGQMAAFLHMQFAAQRSSYQIQFPNAEYQIIRLDGAPVGRVSAEFSPDEVRLIDIAILPGYRGQGIGAQVIRDLQAAAQVVPGRPVRLHVAPHNPARRLYERMGFIPSGGDPMYIEMVWEPRQEPQMITHASFAGRLNTRFRLADEPADGLELELIRVSDLQKLQNYDNFSIQFLSRSETLLEQRIYALEHPALGWFDLFLVPVEKAEEGYVYEAVFNLPSRPPARADL